MTKHGKKYLQASAKIDPDKLYEPREALGLVRETSYTKFDGTVELHVRLGVDPRHAEQQVRDTVLLPHGLGKRVRVLVFAEGDGARAATEAGADIIGDDAVIQRIKDGWLEFDATVATPDVMGKIGKSGLGRILGTRGLMPNPKAGTVVPASDLPRVIKELKAGRVEFRADKSGNMHVPIGKASFETDQLYGNMAALMEAVKRARPPSAKGSFVRKVTVASTMGPGVHVDPNSAQAM
ncbi:MAG TPA: 50S ribosomal protein L1 [Anaerolineales bacterium]|nr:50S ribosomal protein L1 [Anaerolineales bacterium]